MVWFGIFGAVTMVLGFVASHVLTRRFERVGQERLARLLFVFTLAQVAAVIAFALAGSLWLAAASMWVYFLTRSLVEPVYMTWLNQQITDSSVRATGISITGQTDAIGQVVGGRRLQSARTARDDAPQRTRTVDIIPSCRAGIPTTRPGEVRVEVRGS